MFHTSDQSINTEIFLEMVTPDDVRIDKYKVSELKDVPEEQRASMLAALSKEVSDLCRTGAFEFISELPQDRKAIDSKIVFKIKYKADGTYDKHKGRWVAKGFQAKPGVDFFSTFSPMGSLITVRSLFAVAVALGLEIHQADVPQAFIQSLIDTVTYIQTPAGVSFDARHKDGKDKSGVGRLRRALYGLKQAPQLWNKELNRVLTNELGFTRAESDSCMYHFHDDNGFVLLVTEVDDLLITGTNQAKIIQLHQALVDKWNVTDFGPIKSFLGIDVNYNIKSFEDAKSKNPELSMNVKAKVDEIFTKHTELSCLKLHDEALPSEKALQKFHEAVPESLSGTQIYIRENFPSLVGSLIYLSITCRPDLTFAVGKVSRGMHNPSPAHVLMLEYCLGYLSRHRGRPLVYLRSGNPREVNTVELGCSALRACGALRAVRPGVRGGHELGHARARLLRAAASSHRRQQLRARTCSLSPTAESGRLGTVWQTNHGGRRSHQRQRTRTFCLRRYALERPLRPLAL